MVFPRLIQTAVLDDVAARSLLYAVVILPFTSKLEDLEEFVGAERLKSVLKRRNMKLSELTKTSVILNSEQGVMSFVMPDPACSTFERHTVLRKAVMPLLEEHPEEIAIVVGGSGGGGSGSPYFAEQAREVLYVVWLNMAQLPSRKTKRQPNLLASVHLYGVSSDENYDELMALAQANILVRELTVLPPNELTPGNYRLRIKALAKARHWEFEEFGLTQLRKMGAGAFVAVAQGSAEEDAAIVHVAYRPKDALGCVALIGKGICFDTGGHNLKPAKYMMGMHEDMNGSAVALGILQALAQSGVPIEVHAWFAIAQNHISAQAYKQNDVVTALNGTTIEIVHTDAEGRMALADTLALAAKGMPDLMIDFATLTGSMATALGERYSGIFATSPELAKLAVESGVVTGERVCIFPMDEDYEPALDSKIADIKQCTLEGNADHILAARFLKRFTADLPWLHMDLSASRCSEGLGAVATEVTGFGVAWGMEFLQRWLAMRTILISRDL